MLGREVDKLQPRIEDMERNPALKAITKEIDDWESFLKSQKPSSDTENDDPLKYKYPDTLHELLNKEMEAGINPQVEPALQKYLDELEKSEGNEIHISNKHTLCIETVYVNEDKDGNVIEIIEPNDDAPSLQNIPDTKDQDSSPVETSNDSEKATQDDEIKDVQETSLTHEREDVNGNTTATTSYEPLNQNNNESVVINLKNQNGIQNSMSAEVGSDTVKYEELEASGFSYVNNKKKKVDIPDKDYDLELDEFLSSDEDLQVEMLFDVMGSQETTEEFLSTKIIEDHKEGEHNNI